MEFLLSRNELDCRELHGIHDDFGGRSVRSMECQCLKCAEAHSKELFDNVPKFPGSCKELSIMINPYAARRRQSKIFALLFGGTLVGIAVGVIMFPFIAKRPDDQDPRKRTNSNKGE